PSPCLERRFFNHITAGSSSPSPRGQEVSKKESASTRLTEKGPSSERPQGNVVQSPASGNLCMREERLDTWRVPCYIVGMMKPFLEGV
ncbi:MAG: hypothetical protein ACLFPU_10600, partial [Dehalococcoidia bacterium]